MPHQDRIDEGIRAYTRGDLDEARRCWCEVLATDQHNGHARAYLLALDTHRAAGVPGALVPSRALTGPNESSQLPQPQPQPQLQPQPKRDVRARPAILPVIAAFAGAVRGVGRLAGRWYKRIGLRTFVVVPLLVALLGGGAWAVASHRLSLWQRGKEAVSVGSTWWTGARDRVFAVASNVKLAESPTPAPKPVAATEPAAPLKKKTPPAKRRTQTVAQTVAKPAANAAVVAQAPASAAGGVAWRTARWGMTVEEALAAFPSEAVRSGLVVDSSRPLAERAAIKNARLGTVTGTVLFLFGRNGKLAAIAMKPAIGNDSDQTYGELAQWVSGEMGAPTHQESRIAPSGARVEISSWATPDTAVHLSRAPGVAREARILLVDFGSGDIQTVPHGIELWYEPVSSP